MVKNIKGPGKMMEKHVKDLCSDIAPLQGRTALAGWPAHSPGGEVTWEGSFWSLGGENLDSANGSRRTIRLQGSIHTKNRSIPAAGWIEIETISGKQTPTIADLYLVGTRPLPQADITCICRHPMSKDYLVAATMDAYLLLLDARLRANLKVLDQIRLPAPLASLVCCGDRMLGLEKAPGQTLHIINVNANYRKMPGFLPAGQYTLPLSLTALAENDSISAWGLTGKGAIYRLQLPAAQPFSQPHPLVVGETMEKVGRLRPAKITLAKLAGRLMHMVRAVKDKQYPWRNHYFRQGRFSGLAYDGKQFWSFRRPCLRKAPGRLLLYDKKGILIRSFPDRPEVSFFSLNYCHNHLLILDLEHQQLHQYHLADTMEPVAHLAPLAHHHPGYLPAGTLATGGIHDLCLLYVGGEGSTAIHRYDLDKLRPLVGYLTPEGMVKDYFMDGFLLLAQYSPLLNGRSFGVDLEGAPALQEDWLALFNEYFHPGANLQALEKCAMTVNRQLGGGKRRLIKVVLSIPTPDRRCTNWDHKGYSLAEDSHRVEVTRWAMTELLARWKKAKFNYLVLAGFYYMTEQGTWNDLVLHRFPQLCEKYGLRSFAIPGISSSWITEFNRAGFDCAALQSSHAFWQPSDRPKRYLLKCAGRIAREFGMGMEVELPYDVLEPAGGQKLRDYMEMAYIQGWAGAFKAYFQSYNLIKALAESTTPTCRLLYDDLYRMSQFAYQKKTNPIQLAGEVKIECEGKWIGDAGPEGLSLNIEGHQGVFTLTGLSVE